MGWASGHIRSCGLNGYRKLFSAPTSPILAAYNPHLHQLIHVGFKVAAEMGPAYYQALEGNAKVIGRLVTQNLLGNHIKPVFVQHP